MRLTWAELAVDLSGYDRMALLSDWRWLIPESMRLHMVSSIGDAFLRDEDSSIYWLDVGAGTLQKIASSSAAFDDLRQIRENVDNWFVPNLVGDLMAAGVTLGPGQCYSYKIPPTLNGALQPSNLEPTNLAVHFSVLGQIQAKVSGLPPGTIVSGVTISGAT